MTVNLPIGIELEMAGRLENLANNLAQTDDISSGRMTSEDYINSICALRYAIGVLRGIAGGTE